MYVTCTSLRKPVVCYKYGGLAEIVVDDKTGFLVGDNLEEWIDRIEELTSDANLYTKISRAARLRTEEFSWENTARKLEELMIESIAKLLG